MEVLPSTAEKNRKLFLAEILCSLLNSRKVETYLLNSRKIVEKNCLKPFAIALRAFILTCECNCV